MCELTLKERCLKVARINRIEYILFWVCPVLIFAVSQLFYDSVVGALRYYDCGDISNYDFMAAERYYDMLDFYVENGIIFLTIICIPLAIGRFEWKLRNEMAIQVAPEAVEIYRRWSLYRLLILAVPAYLGVAGYYLFVNDTCGICGLLALAASLYCIPGFRRLRKELQLYLGDGEDEDDYDEEDEE